MRSNSGTKGEAEPPHRVADPAAIEAILRDATDRSLRFLEQVAERRAFPTAEELRQLDLLGGPLPESGSDPLEVLGQLDAIGSPATVASTGGRYFGFVIGGALPVAVGANWLAGAWNQNAGLFATSPAAARIEQFALGWTRELLGLPEASEGAFVSGATMANFTGLAAARHAVLAAAGWNVEEQGLAGSPRVTVIAGEEAHSSMLKAISMLGLGRGRVVRVPADAQGRMVPDGLPPIDGPTIVCTQAGNVNSGSIDPIGEIARRAKPQGAWVHVDGAFGLWAAAAPARRHLVAGADAADSWALDGHKWLNVPYDCGLVFVRSPDDLKAAMSVGSPVYLTQSGQREPSHFTPELSRRARGVEVWSVLRSLGRKGFGDLVEGTCQRATQMADGLRAAGHEVLNDVVLNQVVVAFGDDATTARVIAAVQAEGTCWCGATRWHDRTAMRISVSSWATTKEDVQRSLAAILRVADQVRRSG